MNSLSSKNTRQRSVSGIDQSPVFGTPLQLFGVHFGRPCFGQRGSVGRCLSTEDFFPVSRGYSSRLLPPYEGLGLLPGTWVAPIKGECRRSRRYFWQCRTRVGCGPASGPTLKTALCKTRSFAGVYDRYVTRPICLVCFTSCLGRASIGRVLVSAGSVGCCLSSGDFLWPQRAISPGFYPPYGG